MNPVSAGRLTMYSMRSGSGIVRGSVVFGSSNCRRTETRWARLPAASASSSHGRRSSTDWSVAIVSSRGSGLMSSCWRSARFSGTANRPSCNFRPQSLNCCSIPRARTTAPPSGRSMYSSRYQRMFS